ncbi:hypothetical protein MANES_02G018450v8 [Manihot esculenta]|uniref:Uncharacterized protein n=1 Tax=Manihot esculenta TaxID=3983 RepID=A0ACB7I5G9_MANES|nr:hypothetical protein MANES_02G018450v8 [Manihot esculenta]
MNNKVSDTPAAPFRKNVRGTRPLPRRGQIKSKIAANAFHSIVSVLSRASAHRHHSHRKPYLRER